MKLTSLSSILLVNLLATPSFADHFSAQNGSPTITHSPALQHYVATIASYKPETAALTERLQHTISYYQRVHILKTVTKATYTVDCIPFAEQPALIDNPALAQQLIEPMMKQTHAQLKDLAAMGNQFDVNVAKQCPVGAVGIVRPSKTILTSEKANTKIAPHSNNAHTNRLASGYSWEQGATPSGNLIYIKTQANQAYFKGPQQQHVTSTNQADHSLNQFWFTTNVDSTKHPRETLTYSVEFGIIASAYFTTAPATTIFVFASVDNYGANSCYDLQCPNFIQAPGTPAPGIPITNTQADYIFQVQHVTAGPGYQPGYYLTLITHTLAGKSAATSATTHLGFYPDSLYTPVTQPQEFSAGAEVFADAPNNGTLMYGNYVNPCAGYNGPKQIALDTQNANHFPYSTAILPSPYGLVWKFGQA